MTVSHINADVVTLLLSNVDIIEPDLGENETVEVCFNVQFNLPRRRDAVFNFTISSNSTATPGVDFNPQYLEIRVPAYIYSNDTRHCFNITIIGDIDEEGDETIVFDVLAQAEEDLVAFPLDSSAFVITLMDVLGKFCKGIYKIALQEGVAIFSIAAYLRPYTQCTPPIHFVIVIVLLLLFFAVAVIFLFIFRSKPHPYGIRPRDRSPRARSRDGCKHYKLLPSQHD